jgi:type IV pilus assembly protein PilB
MTERNKAGDPPGSDDFRAAVDQVVDSSVPDYKGDDTQPIVRIAHTIIQYAIRDGASEIHVEPHPRAGVVVRFRIDNVLHEMMKLPQEVHRGLVARYKQMAEMAVEEQSVPQDGRIAISHQGKDYDVRVHSEPNPLGENVVLAISARP